jgi:hypothetical protein
MTRHMTEDEAGKLQCCGPPWLATATLLAGAMREKNVDDIMDVSLKVSTCIGSRCMAWRWFDNLNPLHTQGSLHTQGFCGLAGKP